MWFKDIRCRILMKDILMNIERTDLRRNKIKKGASKLRQALDAPFLVFVFFS
mgnify:CR=1 FL=1